MHGLPWGKFRLFLGWSHRGGAGDCGGGLLGFRPNHVLIKITFKIIRVTETI